MKIAIGVDIEKISRFGFLVSKIGIYRLNKIFFESELKYSLSTERTDSHLAACYCAKEATIKALSKFQICNIGFEKIEVLHDEYGMPRLQIIDLPDYFYTSVSVSHSGGMAVATVLIAKS